MGQMLIERKNAGGLWTTTVKTTTSPFSATPIMPRAISNMELQIESDRQTKLNAKYVNPAKQRDFHVNIVRVPGKSAQVEIINGARKHDLTFKVGNLNFANMDGVFTIEVEGTSLGEPIKGKIEGSKNNDINILQMELEKGNKKFLQIDTKIKKDIAAGSFEARTKYAVLGGTIAGKVLLKFSNGVFQFKNTDADSKDSIELIVKLDMGKSLHIEGKKNGESMWTYDTKRTTKDSAVYRFLSSAYPYGAFNNRHNKVNIFVDKKNRNKLAPKFKIDINLEKDGANAVDFKADTTGKPYVFHLVAPNFFKRWNIQAESIDITADHVIGSSLTIDANILGGLHLEAKRE